MALGRIARRPAISIGNVMDVRQLDLFRAVAEEKSFTRAAERLHVSQSAISRQVKLLEEELGGRLLHRGARGATPTAPGELLLRLANRVHRDSTVSGAPITANVPPSRSTAW